jgi:hypothetical protein
MNEFQGTAVIVALFALRCVVPFVLMLALGYGMKRLVRHWESEEAEQPQTQSSIPLPMAARPAVRAAKPALPCWVVNNCDEKTRNACPAYASPSLACWVARLRASGQVPDKCAGCDLYTGTPAFAAGD